MKSEDMQERRKEHGACQVFIAPTDIQLDKDDDKTMVQPDLSVVCDETKITEKCIVGAPDFIVEILSPSTREKDSLIKVNKYRETGVREYWMVDIDKKKVIVYNFEKDCIPAILGYDKSIPVQIYGGKLEITFE